MSTAYSGDGITFPDNSVQATAPRVGMVNRIINGDMRIDQRNAGASVTNTTGFIYSVDRFGFQGSIATKFTVQQSTTAPAGFTNSLLCTSSAATTPGASDYFYIAQKVEGLNLADLGWGAVGAATVTLSFWVRSSLTGTFGGALLNGARNRSYPFTYSISSANTWEQKTVTIAGDTTGTWLTSSSTGIDVDFGLGAGANFKGAADTWGTTNAVSATGAIDVVGTSGATFYITGVQLEAGSVATPFEHRQYGQELALCQRYVYRISGDSDRLPGLPFTTYGPGSGVVQVQFPVTMRTSPSLTFSGTARIQAAADSANFTSGVSIATPTATGTGVLVSGTSAMTTNASGHWQFRASGSYLLFSAEL